MPVDFNSYGARRGNHEVMVRGTFANIRLRNEMADGRDGGWTRLMPDGELMTIYDAAMRYQERGTPLVVIGGKEYGSGSSRDWAAKGVNLLGVKAVIVESFERIHRSNLVGMGVLPLTFKDGQNRKSLQLDGSETIDLQGIAGGITPGMDVACTIHRADGASETDHAAPAGSTPSTRSTTSATAASCTSCCASCSSRPNPPAAPTEQLPGGLQIRRTAPAISETCRQTSLHPAHPL